MAPSRLSLRSATSDEMLPSGMLNSSSSASKTASLSSSGEKRKPKRMASPWD